MALILRGILTFFGCPRSLAFGDRGSREAGLEVAHPLGQLPASLSGGPFRFDLHDSPQAGLIVAKARPLPILRSRSQSAPDRVPVDVAQFLHKLLVRGDVKVIIMCLPEGSFQAAHRDRQLEGLKCPGQQLLSPVPKCEGPGAPTDEDYSTKLSSICPNGPGPVESQQGRWARLPGAAP